jgi:hypothetical protein
LSAEALAKAEAIHRAARTKNRLLLPSLKSYGGQVVASAPRIDESAPAPAHREKAGGRYATGLLLQLPARVRFRCDSMREACASLVNQTLTRIGVI